VADGAQGLQKAERERAWSTPLEDFQVADAELYATDTWRPWFERLRVEDPVHFTAESEFGPYWSVTRHRDIIVVDGDHETFSSSSELGGIAVSDATEPQDSASFIVMDPPRHEAQRRVVSPLFTSEAIAGFAPLIRERAAKILDELPVGETFDFVDKVSVELTSQMLATLFDFPFEHRRMLPRASDLLLAVPGPGQIVETEEQRMGEMFATFAQFKALWDERRGGSRKDDLISLMATTRRPRARTRSNTWATSS
jgi:cytochrome P450